MSHTTKAVEHDLCAAIDHVLLHRSRTSHRCKCGHRMIWNEVKPGECPECDEASAIERIEKMNMERLEQIQEAFEKEHYERDFRIKLALIQTAAMFRATHE